MKLKVSFYATPRGGNPVQKYLHALADHEAAPLYASLRDIEVHGLKGTTASLRSIEGKLWELKVGRHRVFYVLLTGPEMVLLHACKKQGQKARKVDLELSRSRMKEVLEGD
ncbi:type II toxin-antitoxin system RelE/ParE family toxin [Corallococcus aberystwythensis]|uniref:Type II toxin-antitoxin system RelE/ParE family toxin n=1 Tax=Corallococcus aberystwythensis TaxID=2316722 RepID=A0A3A8Q1N6_9BACT|nr:type II toxin-antitoxin system RelE/ParE family toxin [Corallococcus aberystwythensis]RKH62669.1 type II toxin-antitoxin system RelE/ParE family toxin [Corallococcus aberystwythensis]